MALSITNSYINMYAKNFTTDIILINPPSFEECTLNTQPIPLGLIFINRYLQINGFRSKILNLSNYQNWNEIYIIIKNMKKPSIIGISSYTRQRFSTLKLVNIIKSVFKEIIICLGGPHASFLDEAILKHNPNVNYIIRGEGEETFLDIIRSFYDSDLDNRRQKILGISYIDNYGEYIRMPDRKCIKKLSKLPLPLQTKEELGSVMMSDSLKFHFKDSSDASFKMAPIITSRGCNGNCRFCCNQSFWGNNRCTSAEYAFKQFEYYYNQGISCFDVYDDNFTSNEQLVLRLCSMLIDGQMQVKWWCSSRVDTISELLLEKIKQSGCFMISYGVESGSQLILDNINKGVLLKDIEFACALSKKVGLPYRITISIGHLGETEETIQETIRFINKIKPVQVAIFILKVYPGTPLAQFLSERQILSDEYWFNENAEIVPFFTYEHTEKELLEFRNQIVDNINAKILNRYEDDSLSIELNLDWENVE